MRGDICRDRLGSALVLLAARTALTSAMIQVCMSQRSSMVELRRSMAGWG